VLKTLAAFLFLFFLLSLIVGLDGLVLVFGVTAVAVFVIDLLDAHLFEAPSPAWKMRGGGLL
jgi:hypothetical protein